MRLHRTAGANSRSRGTWPVRLRDWSRGSVAAMDARDVRGTELEVGYYVLELLFSLSSLSCVRHGIISSFFSHSRCVAELVVCRRRSSFGLVVVDETVIIESCRFRNPLRPFTHSRLNRPTPLLPILPIFFLPLGGGVQPIQGRRGVNKPSGWFDARGANGWVGGGCCAHDMSWDGRTRRGAGRGAGASFLSIPGEMCGVCVCRWGCGRVSGWWVA